MRGVVEISGLPGPYEAAAVVAAVALVMDLQDAALAVTPARPELMPWAKPGPREEGVWGEAPWSGLTAPGVEGDGGA